MTNVDELREAVLAACYDDDVSGLLAIASVNSGCYLDQPLLENGQNALMMASWTNHRTVRMLLKYGASADSRDFDQRTALFYAVEIDQAWCSEGELLEIVETLIANGADSTATNRWGMSPIDILSDYKPSQVTDAISRVLQEER
jgi:ankyrin repeat protein